MPNPTYRGEHRWQLKTYPLPRVPDGYAVFVMLPICRLPKSACIAAVVAGIPLALGSVIVSRVHVVERVDNLPGSHTVSHSCLESFDSELCIHSDCDLDAKTYDCH